MDSCSMRTRRAQTPLKGRAAPLSPVRHPPSCLPAHPRPLAWLSREAPDHQPGSNRSPTSLPIRVGGCVFPTRPPRAGRSQQSLEIAP